MEGLEPACLSALDPKSSASTSFATSACLIIINNLLSECNKKVICYIYLILVLWQSFLRLI